MNQKSYNFAKVFAGLFIVFFIIALVFYLKGVDSPVDWYDYDEALNKSEQSGKYVFISFYSRWDKSAREFDEMFYSIDSIRKTVEERFIPCRINIDGDQGQELAELYNVRILPAMSIINKKGRVVKHIDGQVNSTLFDTWINDSSFTTIESWPEYDEAIKMSKQQQKNIMLLFVDAPMDLIQINTAMALDSLSLFVQQKFIPVRLSGQYKPDIEKMKTIDKDFEEGRNTIYILNDNKKIIDQFAYSYSLFPSGLLIEKLQQVLDSNEVNKINKEIDIEEGS